MTLRTSVVHITTCKVCFWLLVVTHIINNYYVEGHNQYIIEIKAMKKALKPPFCFLNIVTCYQQRRRQRVLSNGRVSFKMEFNNVIVWLTHHGTDSWGAPARARRWGQGRCAASIDLNPRTGPDLLSRGTSPDPVCPRIWKLL